MGDIGAPTHESFVRKLSLKSDGGDVVERLYWINCSWSRIDDLPKPQHGPYVAFFVDMSISLGDRDTAYDGTTEHENRYFLIAAFGIFSSADTGS